MQREVYVFCIQIYIVIYDFNVCVYNDDKINEKKSKYSQNNVHMCGCIWSMNHFCFEIVFFVIKK